MQQGSGGAAQAVRGAVRRAADMADLNNFAKAYIQYALLNNQGPASLQDIKDSLTPKMIEALQDETLYVVKWKLSNVNGSSIIAYAADPDAYGLRLVAKGDGSVVRMNSTEFEQAKTGQ
jgi:hypothetical protein